MLRSELSASADAVIIGGGPCGLSLAIQLAKKGVQNIILVDDHVNKYTRPGRLSSHPFIYAQKLGLEINMPEGDLVHIKDFERGLYAIAKEMPQIRFIYGRFTGLAEKNGAAVATIEEIESKGANIELPPCRWIFDATGARRAVLKKIAELEMKDPIIKGNSFSENPIGDNTNKRHLLAYVYMSASDINLLIRNSRAEWGAKLEDLNLSQKRLAEILELRHQFNWDSFAIPELHVFPTEHRQKQKASLYVEMPTHFSKPNESEEIIKQRSDAWLRAILKIVAGKEITFTKVEKVGKYGSKEKQRWNMFSVDPTEVKPVCMKKETVRDSFYHIIPIGDAQIGADYRIGNGIIQGMKRIYLLLKCLKFDSSHVNGSIVSFDDESYQKEMASIVSLHKNKIIELYASRSKRIVKYADLARSVFINQWSALGLGSNRDNFMKDLALFPEVDALEIKARLAKAAEAESNKGFVDLLRKSPLSGISPQVYGCLIFLKEGIRRLHDALTFAIDTEKTRLQAVLNERIIMVVNLARELQPKDPVLAKKFYTIAFDSYRDHLLDDRGAEFFATCSNLMTLTKSSKDMLDYADIALARVSEDKLTVEEQSNVVIAKIMYKKIKALLMQSGEDQKETPLVFIKDRTVNPEVNLRKILVDVDGLIAKLQENYAEFLATKKPTLLPLTGKELFQYELLNRRFLAKVACLLEVRPS
jgi:hypothetical protein